MINESSHVRGASPARARSAGALAYGPTPARSASSIKARALPEASRKLLKEMFGFGLWDRHRQPAQLIARETAPARCREIFFLFKIKWRARRAESESETESESGQ